MRSKKSSLFLIVLGASLISCTKKSEDTSAAASNESSSDSPLSFAGPQIHDSANTNQSHFSLPPGLGSSQATVQKTSPMSTKHWARSHGRKKRHLRSKRNSRRRMGKRFARGRIHRVSTHR